jgi:hypothetical protein
MMTDLLNFEDQTVDAEKGVPPWVDPNTPDRPWIDVRIAAPWLQQRPYLVDPGQAEELRQRVGQAGFVLVDAWLEWEGQDPEREFLRELTARLGFNELGAGNWDAFNDRLWDFLRSNDSAPYAIVITGLDSLAERDTYHFLRCVHNLLSLTEGAGLSDSLANRQIEYFFVGAWRSETFAAKASS